MDFSLVFVIMMGAIAAVYLFRTLADYDGESPPHEDESQEQAAHSKASHQDVPLEKHRKKSRFLEQSGSAFRLLNALNPALLYREHLAMKKRLQDYRDQQTADSTEKERSKRTNDNFSNTRKEKEGSGNSEPIKDESHFGRVLGLEGKVSREDIRSAYIGLAKQYHPDKVQHLGTRLRELAEQEMKQLNEAYAYFTDKYGG